MCLYMYVNTDRIYLNCWYRILSPVTLSPSGCTHLTGQSVNCPAGPQTPRGPKTPSFTACQLRAQQHSSCSRISVSLSTVLAEEPTFKLKKSSDKAVLFQVRRKEASPAKTTHTTGRYLTGSY